MRATRPGRIAATGLTLVLVSGGTALAAGGPAGAATSARSCAHPTMKVLDSLDPGGHDGAISALGRGTIAAGTSSGVPVYWIGSTVIRVPLPARFDPVNSYGSVTAINRHDLMVGTIRPLGASHGYAFSYRIGAARAKILPGGTYADDVNDSGQIVGGDDTTYPTTGYVWHAGTVQRTLTVPAGHQINQITGINNAGTIIGNGTYTDPDPTAPGGPYGGYVGLVWPADGSPATHLRPVPFAADGSDQFVTEDIDEHGRIVGERQPGYTENSYETYWDPPYTADGTGVPGLPGYSNQGFFHAISPTTGLIAGTAPDTFGNDPTGTAQIWPGSGPIRALPLLHPPYYNTSANAVADNGNVAGYGEGPDGFDPAIWTCALQQALP
jgi:uncharacterized membrane protein